jgi:hypothetical protein
LHRHAVQAELAKLLPEVVREQVVAVDLGGARRDFVVRAKSAIASRSESMVSPRSKFRPGSCMRLVSSEIDALAGTATPWTQAARKNRSLRPAGAFGATMVANYATPRPR